MLPGSLVPMPGTPCAVACGVGSSAHRSTGLTLDIATHAAVLPATHHRPSDYAVYVRPLTPLTTWAKGRIP